jgi:hypothetical protein
MATGTRTEQAGQYLLDPKDSLNSYLVYVPERCVGAKRCPLVVFLPGAGYGGAEVMDWERPVADKYGTIVISPTRAGIDAIYSAAEQLRFDTALKQVLKKFAIDPDKIALIGRCSTGPLALKWGGANLDVFSRIAAISGTGVPDTSDVNPQHRSTEYLISDGLMEAGVGDDIVLQQQLRRAGFHVKHVLNMRSHAHQAEDYDFVGRWFQESWATPNPAARPAPTVIADPLPLLTTDALTHMTAFWTSFMHEPDSIRTVARRAHLKEVVVPLPNGVVSAPLVDIAALASIYPSVAADLEKAGLTAQQHDVYRVAMISAILSRIIRNEHTEGLSWPIEATSVLGKNVEFIGNHPDEYKALWATKIWDTP